MLPARQSDLRVLFKPFPDSREGGCHVRIWLPPQIPEHCSVVLMFHGGAFAAGQDSDVPYAEVEYLNTHGIVVVSAQYRLLPHVQFPEILQDLLDAYQWVLTDLPRHVPGIINVKAVAVEGWSAGATAACLVGAYHQRCNLPKPTSLYLHYGYFDQQVPFGAKDSAVVHDVELVLRQPMETGLPHERSGEPGTSDRSRWLVSSLVNNTLPFYLNPNTSRRPVPSTYNPLDLITSSFPPCFVLVATKDSLIPPKQSYDFIQKLRDRKVEAGYTEANMEHGQSEVALKGQVEGEYEEWFTDHIRPGLDWTIERLDRSVW